jgi:hypothetical protein
MLAIREHMSVSSELRGRSSSTYVRELCPFVSLAERSKYMVADIPLNLKQKWNGETSRSGSWPSGGSVGQSFVLDWSPGAALCLGRIGCGVADAINGIQKRDRGFIGV